MTSITILVVEEYAHVKWSEKVGVKIRKEEVILAMSTMVYKVVKRMSMKHKKGT